jgi:hypothetical protein
MSIFVLELFYTLKKHLGGSRLELITAPGFRKAMDGSCGRHSRVDRPGAQDSIHGSQGLQLEARKFPCQLLEMNDELSCGYLAKGNTT